MLYMSTILVTCHYISIEYKIIKLIDIIVFSDVYTEIKRQKNHTFEQLMRLLR
jgi:hypothetical protein